MGKSQKRYKLRSNDKPAQDRQSQRESSADSIKEGQNGKPKDSNDRNGKYKKKSRYTDHNSNMIDKPCREKEPPNQRGLFFKLFIVGSIIALTVSLVAVSSKRSETNVFTHIARWIDISFDLQSLPFFEKSPNDVPKVLSSSGENSNSDGTPSIKSHQNNHTNNSSLLNDNLNKFQISILRNLSPQNISVDGRSLEYIELQSSKNLPNSNVRVYTIDNFLTNEECNGLMQAHLRHVSLSAVHDPILCFDGIDTLRKHLKDVGVNVRVSSTDFTEGTTCINETFSTDLKNWMGASWSYSTSFYPGESKFTGIFEDRVQRATGLLSKNGGKFQVTSYPAGAGYKTHTDCVEGNQDKRDRLATILVYLRDVEEGGETEFTELGLSVRPKKGMAIAWTNMDSEGKCDLTSVHKAAAVKKGHKFILQRWYYYQNFLMLGKRQTEPDIPQRAENQPRVSCDQYDNGSCRWYDEWNFEHIIEYERLRRQQKIKV